MAESTESKEIEVNKPLIDLESRLKQEQDYLEARFCQKYLVLHENDERYFEHKVKLKKDRNYTLRAYLNSNYPYQLPDLVVCESPESMPVDSPEWTGSHATHTWPPLHGFLCICHWHWAGWSEKYWIFHVFEKGEIWLAEYEKYLETKKLPLDLKPMILTEKEEQKVQENQLVQFQQQHQALAIWFHFELCRLQMRLVKRILSPIAITEDEIVATPLLAYISQTENPYIPIIFILAKPNAIVIMPAETELFSLQFQYFWAIHECKKANPGCDKVNVSCKQTFDGRVYVSMSPTSTNPSSNGLRSIKST